MIPIDHFVQNGRPHSNMPNNNVEHDPETVINNLNTELAEKNYECEELRVKLEQSDSEILELRKELIESKSSIHETNETCLTANSEAKRAKAIQDKYDELLKRFISLGEENNMYKQQLIEVYGKKSAELDNVERDLMKETENNYVSSIKQELLSKSAQLEFARSKNTDLTDQLTIKDKHINGLILELENAKKAHDNDIKGLQAHIDTIQGVMDECKRFLTNCSTNKQT